MEVHTHPPRPSHPPDWCLLSFPHFSQDTTQIHHVNDSQIRTSRFMGLGDRAELLSPLRAASSNETSSNNNHGNNYTEEIHCEAIRLKKMDGQSGITCKQYSPLSLWRKTSLSVRSTSITSTPVFEVDNVISGRCVMTSRFWAPNLFWSLHVCDQCGHN